MFLKHFYVNTCLNLNLYGNGNFQVTFVKFYISRYIFLCISNNCSFKIVIDVREFKFRNSAKKIKSFIA